EGRPHRGRPRAPPRGLTRDAAERAPGTDERQEMFDIDTWQEILDTIRSNKLRSVLTAFSVAWGIFMLIILLGSGQGLANGVDYQFRDDAINSIWVFSGQTSLPYKGLQPGRRIQMTNDDHDDIVHGVNGIDHITSRFIINGTLQVRYRSETGSFDVR